MRFERVPLIDDVVAGKATLEILSALQSVSTPYAMVAGDVSVSGSEIVVSAQPFSKVAATGSSSSGGWANWFDQINAQTEGGGRRISCIFPMDAASTLAGLDKGAVVSFVPTVKAVTETEVTLDCVPHPE
jgi:hypothetical protein